MAQPPQPPSRSVGTSTPGFSPPPAVAAAYTTPDAESSFLDASPPSDDDLVGVTLSNTYTIVRVLGEGGMGRVYEAKHTRISSKRFAVKTLHPEFARNAEVLTRFHREVEAASSIQSPYVVGVYDVDKTPDGRPFFVAEFLEGSDLGQLLDKQGRLGVAPAVRIVRQVCKALDAAHLKSVVHRDIKPDNIFLTGDPAHPIAKVVDFGISRIDQNERGSHLTKTGIIMGTPSFMSPEQAKGTRSDHRTDIYALGAVLYACLTGTEPFDKGDASATVVAVLTEEPPRPRDIEPSIPEHLESIVQRAMSKEPDERFQSMAELDAALAPYDTDEDAALALPAAVPGGPAAGTRATRAGTMTAVAAQAREVANARPMLVLLLASAGALCVGGLVTATGAVIRMTRGGGELTGTETALVLVAVVCLGLTPGILAIRHVKKSLWGNTIKVVELVRTLRAPLLVATFAYGMGALFVRFCEAVLFRDAARVAWPGWDLLLPLLAVGAGLGTRLAGRLERIDQRAGRAGGSGPVLAWSGIGLGLVIASVGMGVAGSASSAGTTPASSVPSASPSGSASAHPSATPGQTGSDSAPGPGGAVVPAPTSTDVTAEELERARVAGLPALASLAARHPDDAAVLRAVVVSQAASSTTANAAMDNMAKLLELWPDAAADADLQKAVRTAVETGPPATDKALDLLATKMGQAGLDALWDVMLANSKGRTRAEAILKQPEVREVASPALRIALDLREAQTCQAKKLLVDRAASDGDVRSITILAPLSQGTSKGCGFLSLASCPPRCAAEATEFRRAIQAIQGRVPR